MSEGHSPLAQFEITPIIPIKLGAYDVSYTNSALFLTIAVTVASLFLILGIRRGAIVPGRWQSMVELTYNFVSGMVKENVGEEGRTYFPFIFSLFLFILFVNLLGMVPYSFTATSHIAITFAMAAFVFIAVTIIAFCRHGIKFFGFFLPTGTPWWLAPLMVPVEMFAYLARPVSLSIRLAANMMAGHTLLKVIAGFIMSLGVFGVAPFAFLIILSGFEIFVALIQAYIFTILACVYLNDAVHLH